MGTVFKAMSKLMPLGGAKDDSLDHFTKETTIPFTKFCKDGEPLDTQIPVSIYDPLSCQDGNIGNWNSRLLEVSTNYPLVSEGIRRLRNKILHPADKRPIKSILLTSAVPGEGKSFICANLGISLAQGVEKHAILVDCDLRRPTLASLFGIKNENGLVEFLQNNTDLAKLIRKSGLEKLSLLPSGPPPINPAEIVDSQKMFAVISELAERYQDRILILDSPPLLAAAETTVLAQQVDAVVLVVRWGVSGREQVKELVSAIGKEKIIGVVFNAFHVNKVEKGLQKIKGYEGYYKYASGY